jgi:hypothetical protein
MHEHVRGARLPGVQQPTATTTGALNLLRTTQISPKGQYRWLLSIYFWLSLALVVYDYCSRTRGPRIGHGWERRAACFVLASCTNN